MRFLSSAAILCSGLSLLVSASSLEKRQVAADVCVELSAALEVPYELLPGQTINLGILDACICLSAVQAFVETNALCIAASLLAGENKVVSIVTDLINSHNPQSCQYPDHAVPACQAGNPCGFSCTDGYSYSSSQCVCKAPFTSCNGKCILGACPSAYVKRDNSNAGTNNISKRSVSLCPLGYNACGVLGGSETSWECVNTKVDLESCGGCMLPLPSASSLEPIGQDCTAIAGVADVSCVGGSCVVHRCMPGFDVSNDGSSCVERNEWAKFQVAEWM